MKDYRLADLRNSIPDDRHAVRDECQRRSELLAKKIGAARRKLAAMEKENQELFHIYTLATQ